MSKKLLKLEIYSLADFQKADRIDRIRMHMIEPDRFILGNDDQDYYHQLQDAWRLVSNEMRESVSIRLIQEQVDGAESWFKANRLLRDLEALFAPFLDQNRELQKRKVIDRLYKYAEIADKKAVYQDEAGNDVVDQEWLKIAQQFTKDAAEMDGLGADGAAPLNPDEFQIPDFEITSDPQAFLDAQTEEIDAEEYEFDELEDDTDEEDGEDEEG